MPDSGVLFNATDMRKSKDQSYLHQENISQSESPAHTQARIRRFLFGYFRQSRR